MYIFLRVLWNELCSLVLHLTSCAVSVPSTCIIILFTLEFHEYLINFMNIQSTSWIFNQLHEYSINFMNIQSTSWIFNQLHEYSINFMNIQSTSWIFNQLHEYSINFMNIQLLSVWWACQPQALFIHPFVSLWHLMFSFTSPLQWTAVELKQPFHHFSWISNELHEYSINFMNIQWTSWIFYDLHEY